MVAPHVVQPITVAEYYRLAEIGVLREDDRVELIDGLIVPMSAIGPVHATCVTRLNTYLVRTLGDAVEVRSQNPVRLNDRSEPEPDVAVVRAKSYRGVHPVPADVLLLIEVADSSLDFDRGTKLPLYAASGIPEVFLVDLLGEQLERHGAPEGGQYRTVVTAGRGARLPSSMLPELAIPVDLALGYSTR